MPAFYRQYHGHFRALALFAFAGYASAMFINDIPDDKKPQPRSFRLHAHDVIRAEKFSEQLILVLFRNTHAVVFYSQFDAPGSAFYGHAYGADSAYT